jgi:hypothetical protein
VIITGEGDVPVIAILNTGLSEKFDTPMTAQIEFFPSQRLTATNQP